MAQQRITPGTFPESPIPERPGLWWPGDAPLAVAVLIHLEHVEWQPSGDVFVPGSVVHRPPYPEQPDVHEVSPHEYGNRVGIFRLGELLREVGLPATVAMDAMVAKRYPSLVAYCRAQGWELAAHGLAGSRAISEAMPDEVERDYVRESVRAVEEAAGSRPRGWSGVGYQESTRTLRFLAGEGLDYVVGWPNDEQPYWMTTDSGSLVALPVTIHSDDVYALRLRRIPVDRWERITRQAFDRLLRDGETIRRTMVITLNPWVSGQPYRIRHVRALFEHVASQQSAWFARCDEIVDAFVRQSPRPGEEPS